MAWLDDGKLERLGAAGDVVDGYLGRVQVTGTRRDDPSGVEAELSLGSIAPVDAEGQVIERVRSGDPITLRIEYQAIVPVAKPLFRVTIATTDGFVVAVASSRKAPDVADVAAGSGALDLVVPSLPMLPGTYDVSVMVTDQAGLHELDRRRHACRLEVAPGVVRAEGGIVDLGATWRRVDG